MSELPTDEHGPAPSLTKHPGAVGVRLAVQAAGCSGYSYRVDPADAIHEEDVVVESGQVRFIADTKDLPYLQGVTVDVVADGLERRIRFENPNANQTCSCGESFQIAQP